MLRWFAFSRQRRLALFSSVSCTTQIKVESHFSKREHKTKCISSFYCTSSFMCAFNNDQLCCRICASSNFYPPLAPWTSSNFLFPEISERIPLLFITPRRTISHPTPHGFSITARPASHAKTHARLPRPSLIRPP